MTAFVDQILAHVRALLRQDSRFANMSRVDLDVHLGDLEREIEHDIEDWIAATEREIRADLEYDIERAKEYAKRAKTRKKIEV
jgi:hypothetical protein